MKKQSCGWRRSYGIFSPSWRRGKPRIKGEGTGGVHDYMTHVSDAASYAAYQRQKSDPDYTADSRASGEALPENSGLINFKEFAEEYPDKLWPLLERLRPEFQELFAEYWLLGKSQSFLGHVHGFIQTRVWQNLRIIEQALGALILLGPAPDAEIIRPILRKAGLEDTEFDSLTFMILKYAESQNYSDVALRVGAPTPAVRKIFRPAIKTLLASSDLKTVAVGAYLHSLTHQASLTGFGLSKSNQARIRRVKTLRFKAPPLATSPLISFNRVDSLEDTPWCLLEVSSEQGMLQLMPLLHEQGKKIFGKKPAQIFAPVDAAGELQFGYIFARSVTAAMTRKLTRIRGVGEMSTVCDNDGNFVHAVTIPHAEVLGMIAKHNLPTNLGVRAQDFVEILTGDAKGYCGTVTRMNVITDELTVEVRFPTGRCFLVRADVSSVRPLPAAAPKNKMFWGIRPS